MVAKQMDSSAMLLAYMSRANGPEHLGNQSEDRLLKRSM